MKKILISLLLTPASFMVFAQINVTFDTLVVACFDPLKETETFIINDEQAFKEIFEHNQIASTCPETPFPIIDFESKTLIGYRTFSGGCQPPWFEKKIEANKDKYTITIRIKNKGACRKAFVFMHWFIVDKIDKSKSIAFETKFLKQ